MRLDRFHWREEENNADTENSQVMLAVIIIKRGVLSTAPFAVLFTCRGIHSAHLSSLVPYLPLPHQT